VYAPDIDHAAIFDLRASGLLGDGQPTESRRIVGSDIDWLVIALFVAHAEAKELIGSAHSDDCLVAPNSPAPQGSRWNFRLGRKTQRKCWIVGCEFIIAGGDTPTLLDLVEESGMASRALVMGTCPRDYGHGYALAAFVRSCRKQSSIKGTKASFSFGKNLSTVSSRTAPASSLRDTGPGSGSSKTAYVQIGGGSDRNFRYISRSAALVCWVWD
jgi:hypothetical protein